VSVVEDQMIVENLNMAQTAVAFLWMGASSARMRR